MTESEFNPPLFRNRWAVEAGANSVRRPSCTCLDAQYGEDRWTELAIHQEQQDTTCSAWTRLLELIDEAANDRREVFSPGPEMTPDQWSDITTLPQAVAKLKSVKHLNLYGSTLVRIPPEIGEMSSLEEFTPYTSYRLHWFPYEILRCNNLNRSTISTSALYGNHKYRPPFPRLPQASEVYRPTGCSICNGSFGNNSPLQFWVSLPVATDIIPLLVHACSDKCASAIPKPPKGYIQKPHRGGLQLIQPQAM